MTSTPAAERRFLDLYEANMVALLGCAARRVDRVEDAADVVADVFTAVWHRIDDVPPGDQARPWLNGIARNVLSNHRRSAQRRQRLQRRVRQELRWPKHSLQVQGNEVDDVRHALGRLSADDRELLLLTSWSHPGRGGGVHGHTSWRGSQQVAPSAPTPAAGAVVAPR